MELCVTLLEDLLKQIAGSHSQHSDSVGPGWKPKTLHI